VRENDRIAPDITDWKIAHTGQSATISCKLAAYFDLAM